ncbi:MAG: DNA cytosine methyltransferase [Gammaproteobacteria bacterium AqS3]|nr:DNA cytosine methyltransferase [Gammaproteobacteria bacterium AqS3]
MTEAAGTAGEVAWGFPDEFIFPFSAGADMMQMGNAVPPIVGHALAGAVGGFLVGVETHRPQAEVQEVRQNEMSLTGMPGTVSEFSIRNNCVV